MKNKFLLYQLPIISICIALIMYLYTFDKEDLNPGNPTPTEFIQKKEDRRIILADKNLMKLLRINKNDQLTYFNLQRYMSPHFAKAGKAAPKSS